jgi:predicted DNA-binding protein
MSSRRRRVHPGPIRPDVDLDRQELRLPDSRRLTEELASRIAEGALARHRGRPSVTGQSRQTPSLTLRVPPRLREKLEEIAAAQGRHLSEVGRDALDEYIRHHPAS